MSLKLRNISSSIVLFSCIDRVLQLFHKECSTVFSVNTDYSSKWPSIQYRTEMRWNSFSLIKPGVYVIDSTNDDLESILKSLETKTFFNPAALFLLITDLVDSRSIKILRDYFTYKFIFIDNSKSDSKYFYTVPNLTEASMIGNCTQSSISLTQNIFETEDFSNKWNGKVVEVGIGNSPPSVIQESPRGPYAGIDIEIIEFIAARMQFKIQYKLSENFVGVKVNNTYNGALGMLARRSVDLVMGGMFATKTSCLDFSVSYPIHWTSYSWFVPGPVRIPFWKRVFLIYQPAVSLAILFFYVLMTVILIAFNLILKGENKFYDELFKLYSSASSAPIRIFPKEECSKKIFYVCWFMFWLVLNASFASKLLECLIRNKYSFPINSLEALEKAKLEVCILSDLEFGLKEYGGKVTTCTECDVCLNRTAFRRDSVTVRNTDLVNFYKSNYYLSSRGDPLIHALKEKYFAVYNVMMFRKNHPIFERFNEILRRMITSGIIAHMRHKYNEAFWDKNPARGWSRLKLQPLKFVFQLWFYGLILSIVTFVTEMIMIRHKTLFIGCR